MPGKAKVLIVEDEGIIAMTNKIALLQAGYDVLPIAITGKSALVIAEQHRPDIVLMDIRLRGQMDGIEAAIRIKALYVVPIIYLTSYTNDETLDRARATDPVKILLKPIEPETLIEELAQLL